MVKVAALRHGGLVMLSDLKRKLWYSYVFEQWDQILMPEKSQEEKVDIELGLRRRDDRTDAEHYREMIALAYCKISSEASQLDKEAEALFQKWYDRFPDGSAGVPTPAELQQMDREVESLLARVKVLPKLTSEQIETEITALPPRDLRTIVR